jgi:hypothetical protein
LKAEFLKEPEVFVRLEESTGGRTQFFNPTTVCLKFKATTTVGLSFGRAWL